MAVEVKQLFQLEGSVTKDGRITLHFLILGTDNDATAETALLDEIDATYRGLVRGQPNLKHIGYEAWHATVEYIDPDSPDAEDPPETGESEYHFEIGGETVHITQSISNISRTKAGGGDADDHKGAIGVQDDLTLAGVDIFAPTYHFSETHYLALATVSAAYKATLAGLAYRVNNDTFKGFAAGEVLFMGASGSQRGSDDWQINFSFAARPNEANVDIGGVITVPAIKGWEYLWVRYKKKAGAESKVLQPRAAYVEQVYKTGDFSNIGIGT
ncbi:MAG: hypothetical protein ACYS5V_00080 [Planctomycetota bacterium]|jgi:hypothetical protein